jgi:hypothetical protein
MDSLTSQVNLFLRDRSDKFLQCLVTDVRGTPFRDHVQGKIATKLHRGSNATASLWYNPVISYQVMVETIRLSLAYLQALIDSFNGLGASSQSKHSSSVARWKKKRGNKDSWECESRCDSPEVDPRNPEELDWTEKRSNKNGMVTRQLDVQLN